VTPIRSKRLELVSLSPEFIDALLAGRRDEAEAEAGITLPEGWPDRHDAGFLRIRAEQMRRDPGEREWLVRAITLPQNGRPMIGHIGFHGKPGINGPRRKGALEVGYTVLEPFRGRGYATEAVETMLAWARGEHGITHFVASVAPANAPSLAIIRKLGFEQTGTQWDEEDGEELVFELSTDER
jgi:[ribosomal protein S5]-alanine N-acetyltransferase